MTDFLLGVFDRTVLRRPWLVVLGVLFIAFALALGLPKFKLDASADSLTLEHDKDLDYFREVNQRYGSGDFLVVMYTPREGDLFSDQAIATLDALQKDLATIDGVVSVNSMVSVPLLYSPRVSVEALEETPRTLLSPDVDRAAAKQEFLTSPVYRKLILSPDGRTTAVLASISPDRRYVELVRRRDALRVKRDGEGLSAQEASELQQVAQEFLDYRTARAAVEKQRVEEVRRLMDKYRDKAEVFLGGPSMITADMIDFIRSDLQVFGVGIGIFIIATLTIIFRQLRWVLLPLSVCILTLVMMLGWLSWIDWRLTVISSNFVALLLITTLALTIHLVVRYRELLRTNPEQNQLDLVRDTVSSMARPCLYTVLTTVVAFASLVVSNIRPVIDFGWMMTIGLSLALVLAFIIIPAGMTILGKGQGVATADNSARLTAIFSRFTERHGNVILVFSLILAGLAGYGVTLLKVENRFIDYFKPHTEIYQGLSVIDAKLGGTTPLDIILDAPSFADIPIVLGAIYGAAGERGGGTSDDPDGYFDGAEAGRDERDGDSYDTESASTDPFAEEDPYTAEDPFAEEDPFASDDPFAEPDPNREKVSYWFSRAGLEDLEKIHAYLDSLPEIGRVDSLVTAFHVANDLTGRRLNDLELTFMRRSLSPELERFLLAPYLDDDANQARITMRTVESGGTLNRKELLADIESFLIDEVGLEPDEFQLSGLQVLYNNMLQSLFRSQIVTLGAVFLGILVMFIVLFRSFSISLIAILPNMLAAGIVLGSMGIAGIPLDMMTITIAAITVGIGVDHAIHYLTRFKREFAIDQDYVAAMHRAHASIGLALFYTAITIIIGFSILTFSNFMPSVYFGLLTALAMFAALLGSLTLLPKLILLIRPLGEGVKA
jgi:uncharacterized protein